MNMGDKKVK
jgi:hypothetical protein